MCGNTSPGTGVRRFSPPPSASFPPPPLRPASAWNGLPQRLLPPLARSAINSASERGRGRERGEGQDLHHQPRSLTGVQIFSKEGGKNSARIKKNISGVLRQGVYRSWRRSLLKGPNGCFRRHETKLSTQNSINHHPSRP
jgi:hypothetical protein